MVPTRAAEAWQGRTVAEGFFTSAAAWELSRKLGVDMPITDHVFHVLHRGRPLSEAVDLLLYGSRGEKFEIVLPEGARVAIIDDVVTTGATACSLAEAVLAAGAGEVHLWAATSTPRSA